MERKPPQIVPPLLDWYHRHRRVLPFREDASPYKIWVSEIMLQQTRMETVLPYYERFIQELPDVAALAACGEERLHKLWQGLGYYNRARNMQKAARIVMDTHGGALPANYDALLTLPGIGPYTAGAIASIAFGLPVAAVDGNVLRVFSRLLASEADITLPATKRVLSDAVYALMPKGAPGDYNQALMELGALVCIPASPRCAECPLVGFCTGYQSGLAPTLPRKTPAKEKTILPVCVLRLRCEGKLLLHRRPAMGFLAGMWEPFTLEGYFTKQEATFNLDRVFPGARLGNPLPASRHIFTHRVWEMYGWAGEVPLLPSLPAGYTLVSGEDLKASFALPSAFNAYLPPRAALGK